MGHSIPNTTKNIQLFLLYLLLANLFYLNSADPPYHTPCLNNSTSNSTTHTQIRNNLNTLLSSLLTNPSFPKQNNSSFGKFPDAKVYVQYMCLNYETNATCQACVESASELIEPLCPNDDDSTVWEENCQLRYSNKNFLGQLDVSGIQAYWNAKNMSDPEKFRQVINETVSGLAKQAAFNVSAGMYATGAKDLDIDSGNRIFALVQCTTDLSPSDCFTCLMVVLANVSSCCYFSRGARVLGRSCYLRYELYNFYGLTNDSDASPSATNKAAGKRHAWRTAIVIVAIVLLVVALSILGVSFCCLVKRKKMKRRNHGSVNQEVQSQSQDIMSQSRIGLQHLDIPGREGLNSRESGFIDLTSILKATNNFSDSNLLGRGGFGPVYKGILADGQEVAVKRLSSCSEQGNEEFTNEVLLIMKLQHKNLVRLLGYCIDGEEKLLVYEFMPNGSLDVILFDPTRRPELSWSRRISIINGVAKGMLYLHEDSRLRIVHRDLKASNVLLDINMNPKISDFGMARIFGGNESDSSSTARIVGTYGYMAPEYAMEGLYSIKSDVFGFGVLLIEIITGRRNMGFHKTKLAANLIAYAWQLWKEGKEEELMDPLVKESCSSDEFSWLMRIGLLCVQEDANDRPTMSSVVLMLKSDKDTTSLPLPQHSAFNLQRFMDQLEANSGQLKGVDFVGEIF